MVHDITNGDEKLKEFEKNHPEPLTVEKMEIKIVETHPVGKSFSATDSRDMFKKNKGRKMTMKQALFDSRIEFSKEDRTQFWDKYFQFVRDGMK